MATFDWASAAVVVLSLLRSALGSGTAPPNAVMISLALFLTAFVMAPTFERAWEVGLRPLMQNEIQAEGRAFLPLLDSIVPLGAPVVIDHSGRPDPKLGVDDMVLPSARSSSMP